MTSATPLTPDRALALVTEWERETSPRLACDFYWPGRWDLRRDENRCVHCDVPKSIHEAYRVLTHGGVAHA